MGISHLADAVTGQSFSRDEPVVAVVIRRKVGGYPDAVSCAASPGVHPDHMFQQVSLPIRARAGAYGDVEVMPDQAAVRLACQLTGAADWEGFTKTALDWQTGAVVKEFCRFSGEGTPEVLGVAAFGIATWRTFQGISLDRIGRDAQVSRTLEFMLDAIAWVASDDGSVPTASLVRSMSVISLKAQGEHAFADGRVEKLPRLASVLSDGWLAPLASPLVNQLTGMGGPLDFGRGDDPSLVDRALLKELLEGLWDSDLMRRGLHGLNRYLLPSAHAGQHDNAGEIATAAMESLEHSVGATVARALDLEGEDALAGCEAILSAIDDMRDRVSAMIAEAKAALEAASVAP